MKIEAIDLKKLREQLSNWRASAPANLHPSYILDALAPQVIALLDEIDHLRTDVDLRGPDGACCRARRRAEDQLVAMTQARNEACEWWELHLKGFAKRQGDPDGGILREHECLERTKKIGLYMDRTVHGSLDRPVRMWRAFRLATYSNGPRQRAATPNARSILRGAP